MTGLPQVAAWDRTTDRRTILTHTRHGVSACDIEPRGDFVWWFTADPAGHGSWRRQPFAGGPAEPALRGVPVGRQQGIAFGGDGDLAAVCVGVDAESRCYLGPPGGPGQPVATAAGYASLIDMTADGRRVALAGRADSDQAVIVIDLASGRVDTVPGTRDRRVWGLEFRPGPAAEPELLAVVEAAGRYTVGTWRPDRGLQLAGGLSFDSEITAHWYGSGEQVLLQHDRAGRSRLLLAHLGAAGGGRVDGTTVVPTPTGTILDLSCAPDGTIHFVWSRESVPPRRLVTEPTTRARTTTRTRTRTTDRARTTGGDRPAPAGRRELWTRQPYGRIHSFLATPPGAGPWPTLFLVHGGPYLHDRDSYDPRVEAFVRAGYAVVRSNYRGSTGYGPRWRHDFGHRVGLAQLEDLAAVRRHVVELGVAAPGRIGLCGYSWGGYLVLLAVGVQPDDWAVGLAVSPVADYPAAHRNTTPALREVDEELFGGTPDEVPSRYRAADPMTYVHEVRTPLFVAAAPDDERCPAEPVERYVAALRRRSVPHRLVWMEGGHHGTAAGHTAVLAELLRYAAPALGPAPHRPRADAPAPASPDDPTRRPSDRQPVPEGR